jgi:3-deoxy-D-manno-octulosonic-acid transferase
MYWMYSFLLFLCLAVYLPVYWVRHRLLKKEKIHFLQRLGFGLGNWSNKKKSLWIHAVSVGEVLSLQNLIREIKKTHHDWTIHFSCLTNSGFRVAQEKLNEADHIFFIPLDFTTLVKKFFRRIKPDVFILAESEFWPNLLKEANKSTLGVLLINGRISHRSFKHYKRIKGLIKSVLSNINLFLVQTERDKNFLEKIHVDPHHIRVVGNLKAEIGLDTLSHRKLSRMREGLGISGVDTVVVAGSVHKGEEEVLLEGFNRARQTKTSLKLILVPRHPERTGEMEKTCREYRFDVKRKTQLHEGEKWDVLILDTLGELAQFYALSDVAFVGGSLIPWGGHNLLEPAFYQKAIFFGPHMDNFAYLAEIFVESGAARIIRGQEELVAMFLAQDKKAYQEMGQKAKDTLQSLQGATKKTLQAIESFMGD